MIRSGADGVRPNMILDGECSEGDQGCDRAACCMKKETKKFCVGVDCLIWRTGATRCQALCHTVPLDCGKQHGAGSSEKKRDVHRF